MLEWSIRDLTAIVTTLFTISPLRIDKSCKMYATENLTVVFGGVFPTSQNFIVIYVQQLVCARISIGVMSMYICQKILRLM
jgi:hypothetical protein